jgi:fructokinase
MDLISVQGCKRFPMVGGGAANTAKALARLGHRTFFIGGISHDLYGAKIDTELRDSGVNLSLVYRDDLPTALAIATIDESGLAKYEFEIEGTSSFAFSNTWLPSGKPDAIHVGSVATLVEPGASELLNWISTKSAPVVFDPNVRPAIENDRKLYRTAVERWLDNVTIIKMSEDDLRWLFDESEETLVKSWLGRGISMVIITRAERGMSAYCAEFEVSVGAVSADVVDTVGAGDTVGAVVVEGLLQYGLPGLNQRSLALVLSRAAKAAAITCSRAGANPPWREELDQA